ncbi:glycoside hydrolase family 74 protein [Tulasnella calospora MUT 4182]|uniref:Glycoside hydrolase family 74 protein n=1 Tax=Tulasnella calospora MUT 4182 TaxID=1051891 RepID=A0A0C3QPL1_9AGAM|nr:glycoside hydrolase family 74 protein [Tulasnella calospora MUT 4182]
MLGRSLFGLLAASLPLLVNAATSWKQVKVGGGGGFVPGIVFSTKTKGVAYARTDIGGLYKLNSDDTWTPLLDWVGNSNWHDWGVDALALDPTNSNKLYIAVGMYTNSWDPNNGSILSSSDSGSTWTEYALPFKVGGNMPGRGLGERLAVDPNLPTTLYFGARSGNGLWKSTNSGATWTQVTSFPSTGTYIQDPTYEYTADKVGLAWVTFDGSSSSSGSATKRIFVGVANVNSTSIYYTEDAGSTWAAVPGQPTTNNLPHKGVISPSEGLLYVTFNNNAGPYDGTTGSIQKYNIASKTWTNITPVSGSDLYFGFGGLAVDLQKPGTIMVAALNSWWPDGQIFRSTDSGATWTTLWSWASYPTMNKYYTYDVSLAPWISTVATDDTKQIGWMMECLVIDPFDSNHWLYGTGLTIYGGHDLLNWDSSHMVTLKSLADGIEETAVQALISPPVGPNLLSGLYDVHGFAHSSLDTAPSVPFTNPFYTSTVDLDWAGQATTNIVRGLYHTTNSGASFTAVTGFGATWSISTGAAKTTGGYPSVFAIGTYNSVVGVYRSDDQGSTWTRLDDAAHAFGAASANVVSGDQRIWGRVYVGTNGRGIFYGDDSSSSTSTTTSKTSTTSSSTTKTSSTSTSTTTSKTSSTTTTTTTSSKSSSTTTSSTTSKASSTTTTTTATGTGTACHYCQVRATHCRTCSRLL